MKDQQQLLQQVLQQFEERADGFGDHEIQRELDELVRNIEAAGEEPEESPLWESMVFRFAENYRTESGGWGTYYGPMAVLQNESGQWVEAPSIKRVTEEGLDYWENRFRESSHPVLKIRYADIVWDFSKSVLGKGADIEAARCLIDSTVKLVGFDRFKYPNNVVTKLTRALNVAVAINDQERLKSVAEAILRFEQKYDDLANSPSWGFAYDLIIENPRVPHSSEQEQQIIEALHRRFTEAANTASEKFNPHTVEEQAIRLARFYQKKNQHEQKSDVLATYAEVFTHAANQATNLLGSTWLRKVYEVLTNFGLPDHAKQLEPVLREMSEKSVDEFQEHRLEFEIPQDQFDEYLRRFSEDSVETALKRIAAEFVPDRNKTEQQVIDLSQKAPLQGFISQTMMGSEGRMVANIGSVEEDLDGRVVTQTSQNLSFEAIFLDAAISKIKTDKGLNKNHILEFLRQSPLFSEDILLMVEKGIDRYFHDDFISACHILLPQIEGCLRQLLRVCGAPILKRGRHGGMDVRLLGDLLHDPLSTEVLGEDFTYYLKVLLIDPRGWNFRNEVSHGLAPPNQFTHSATNRILQALLYLGLTRMNENEDGDKE